jgi:hydrogenase expression/formation protein HypC
MCLAVPGKVVAVTAGDTAGPTGAVDFQGSRVEASFALTPDAKPGDWVLMHAGFAIEIIEEEQAREIWQYLDAMSEAGPPSATEPTET